ncbi:hypothetical protein NQ318_019168, partial [Aromia moschata]
CPDNGPRATRMPADEDYGRRQQQQQQIALQQQQHAASQSSQSLCPAGCVGAAQQPPDHRQQQQECPAAAAALSHRYASDKNLLEAAAASPSDRFAAPSDRFGSERSSSDRLPSGERYQGVSERYPLGERPQTSVSTDRLLPKEILQTTAHCQGDRQAYQPERYSYERSCQSFPERYTPVQNLGSLDRYHVHATMDRYSRTATPTDRYHTLSTDKERCVAAPAAADRYIPIEKYSDAATEDARHSSAQSICSIERYTPTERHRSGSKSDIYKIRDRSASSDRKERERQYQSRFDQYVNERFNQDRFPAIPCPERFATQERLERPDRVPFSQVPYMEPPSPAPTNDRFIPPPPLSPDNTPSPDCFSNNTFPSPTAAVPPPDRFIPPPPLSPSPTDNYAHSPKKLDRYDKPHRYHAGYAAAVSPNNSGERYHHGESRYKDRFQSYQGGSGHQNYHSDKYVNGDGRYGGGERYVPRTRTPQSSDTCRNRKSRTTDQTWRSTIGCRSPYAPSQYQRVRYSHAGTPNRIKCCQYQEGYQLSKTSPGSSSSSSVASQGKVDVLHQKDAQEIQCQNYQSGKEYQCLGGYHHHHQHHQQQQEKGTQCGNVQCQGGKECIGGYAAPSPNLLRAAGRATQCRHNICASPSVEYVGASGGRHVCATPPPRAGVVSAEGATVCTDNCCARRTQNSLSITVW